MTEAVVGFVAGVVWEFVLYGTGRLLLAALSLGAARAEAISGDTAQISWSGFGRDPSGALVLSQTWTGLLGGAVWLFGFLALLLTRGRI